MKTRFQCACLFPLAFMAVALCAGSHPAWAQSPSGAVTVVTNQPKALLITIIDGEGALNDVRTRTAREPIVEVDDENHKPVAGALVVFAIDNGGSGTPFASFAGAQSISVPTDAAGRATAKGFQITQHKGKFHISVHASLGQLEVSEVIAQTNIAGLLAGSTAGGTLAKLASHKLFWIIGGVAAGGVVTGVAIVTHQSQTSITPGTGTVGAPAAVPGISIQLHRPHR